MEEKNIKEIIERKLNFLVENSEFKQIYIEKCLKDLFPTSFEQIKKIQIKQKNIYIYSSSACFKHHLNLKKIEIKEYFLSKKIQVNKIIFL